RAARRLPLPARQTVYGWLGVAWGAFALNVAFLVFLSLWYPPESWGPWTYVQETRYFGLNMAIVTAVLVFLLCWRGTPAPRYVRYALYALSLFLFGHAYAFAPFKYRVNEPVAPSEPLATAAVVQQRVRNAPGPVVFASDQVHNYWDNVPVTSMGMFGAMGGASIIHVDSLVRSHPCTRPITVLVAVVYNPPAGLEALYRQGNARQVGTVGEGIPLMQLSLTPTPAQAP
ncbi:MAG: hypothetical protein ICV83_33610, partial [Cytophagales bacterium]|nr:hypothetical protein [Cytophagales bacterium]